MINKFIIAIILLLTISTAQAKSLVITDNYMKGAIDFCKIHGGLKQVTFKDFFFFHQVIIECKDNTVIKSGY